MKPKESGKNRKYSEYFTHRRKSIAIKANALKGKKTIRKLEKEFAIFKKNIMNAPELKDDIHTINLILLLKRYNNLPFIKESPEDAHYDKQDYDLELLTKKIFTELHIQRLFWYFFSYLKISENNILMLIPLLKYEYYPAKNYVCKEGDRADYIYFLLAGKILFKKNFVSLDSTIKTPHEIDQGFCESGGYFGEWDIIYERKTKLSAYCIENCHIIKIDRENFKIYFEQNFLYQF